MLRRGRCLWTLGMDSLPPSFRLECQNCESGMKLSVGQGSCAQNGQGSWVPRLGRGWMWAKPFFLSLRVGTLDTGVGQRAGFFSFVNFYKFCLVML